MQLEIPTGYGELILIAEDEASISEITSSALNVYGYRVLTAADGADEHYMSRIKMRLRLSLWI